MVTKVLSIHLGIYVYGHAYCIECQFFSFDNSPNASLVVQDIFFPLLGQYILQTILFIFIQQ